MKVFSIPKHLREASEHTARRYYVMHIHTLLMLNKYATSSKNLCKLIAVDTCSLGPPHY